jgi:hypothetical protein
LWCGFSSSEAWKLLSLVLSWRLQGLFDNPAGTPTLFRAGFFLQAGFPDYFQLSLAWAINLTFAVIRH